MAINDERLDDNDRLRGLDDLGDYKVADGEPDPRGWEVCAGSDKIGEVDDLIVDTVSMKVKFFDVDLEDEALGTLKDRGDDHVSIPVERVQLDYDRKRVILGSGLGVNDLGRDEFRYRRPSSFERAHSGSVPADRAREYDLRGRGDEDERTLTRAEEEVDIHKDRVQTGEVIVGKHVETEHFRQPVSRQREEVDIERRPVSGRTSDATIGAGQDEVRIPITEEEVHVEKRPVVKEELVINKRTVQEDADVDTEVRKEQFDVQKRGRDRE